MKHFKTLSALALSLSCSGMASATTHYETVFVEVDFLREVYCELPNIELDFGRLTQDEKVTITTDVVGNCANDIRVVAYPIDKGEQLTGELAPGTTYTVELAPLEPTHFRDNVTGNHCSGEFMHIDESGCHLKIDTGAGGIFFTQLEATLSIDGKKLDAPVTLHKTIPLEVFATYEE